MEMAFGILSANEPAEAVTQLVASLGDDDDIVVHHDYSKQPGFSLPTRRPFLIPDYVETAWGSPGLPLAIFHLIRTALRRSRFDYFQLLSGSCLPLRPIHDLKRHLSLQDRPIHADLLNLDADERVMMSHGHRVFCRAEKLASRLLSRSRRWYFGDDPITVQQANLGIHDRSDPDAQLTPWQWIGKQVHVAARVGLLDNHPFHGDMTPFVGSLWFCLRRDVCEYLVQQEEDNPFVPYLLGLEVCDEILFPTLLGNSAFGIAASNHLVNDFVGSHPRTFDDRDLPALADSDRFFARKFSTGCNDVPRRRVLTQLEERRNDQRALSTAW